MKVKITGVAETLLIPLWARAVETKHPYPIVKDELAAEIIDNIDYDLSKFDCSWMSQVGVAIRTMLLDKAAMAFIEKHPDAVVINIGAGLDTRFSRIDNNRICWYDLDLPEVILIRKQFFQESKRYQMLAKSAFDTSWVEHVNVNEKQVLIIAEGILMYFDEEEVKRLMENLVAVFPKAEMLFEMMTPTLAKKTHMHDAVSKMDALFKWGIKSGKEMERLNPAIQFVEEWNYFDFHRKRWRWMRWLALIPAFKNRFNNRIVHLRFA